MKTVKFNAHLLAAVTPCICTEQTRYYLTGIYFEPHPNGGAYALATDGTALACAFDPEGEAPEDGVILYGFKELAKDLKPARNDQSERVFTWADNVAKVSIGDSPPLAYKPMVEIDGTFPDWRRIIPLTFDVTVSAHMTYGAAQLKRLHDMAAILGTKETTVSFFAESDTMPAVVRFANEPNIFAVQMPARSCVEGPALPEFYRDEVFGKK